MTSRRTAVAVTVAAAAVGAYSLYHGPAARSLGIREARVVRPAPTVTAFPAPVVLPTARVVAAVERPVAPALLRQLTTGGCCPVAWWSEDSRELRFVDRPEGAPGAAIYGVPLWPPGSPMTPVDAGLDVQTSARYVVRPDGGHSVVQDLATGSSWSLPTSGSPVLLSPDGSRAVWWTAEGGEEHIRSLVSIFASAIDGSGVLELARLWRADVVAFHPDGRRVLITGRSVRGRSEYVLAMLDTFSGELKQLARGSWLSDAALSRSGEWVAFMISLDNLNPGANGIWVVPTAGGQPRQLGFVGAFRWRDAHRLVYVPMAPGSAHHSVWQYDAATGETVLLLDPVDAPLRIANNDWSVSPDGMTMAFVSEDDRNVWVVDLP